MRKIWITFAKILVQRFLLPITAQITLLDIENVDLSIPGQPFSNNFLRYFKSPHIVGQTEIGSYCKGTKINIRVLRFLFER